MDRIALQRRVLRRTNTIVFLREPQRRVIPPKMPNKYVWRDDMKRGNLCAEQYQKDSNPSKDDMVVRQKYLEIDRLERVGCLTLRSNSLG